MQEKTIEFYSDGLRLDGTLYIPDSLKPGESRAAVVACSGYLGLNTIYPRLFAEPLTNKGYVVLGFDYRGNSSSEGTAGRLVIEEQVRDIRNAISFLRQQPEVRRDQIGLIGWGMGAANVIQVTAFDKRVKAVAALNGFYDGRSFLEARHGEEGLTLIEEQLEQDRIQRATTGKGRFTDPYEVYPLDPDTRNEVAANLEPVPGFGPQTAFELLDSLLALNVEDIVHKISPRPLFVAHGEHNLLHPFEGALALYGRAGKPRTFHRISGKHNDFMRSSHPQFSLLVDTLGSWLSKHLDSAPAAAGHATSAEAALLAGTCDVHVHSSPSKFPRLLNDHELTAQAAQAGMRAIVLKTHEGSTVERAQLAETLAPPREGMAAIIVRGGITLNHYVGGINPHAAEVALELSAGKACFVWLPTIHARNHIAHYGGTTYREMPSASEAPVEPLSVLDPHGRLTNATLDLLDLLAKHPNAVLSSGHLNTTETAELFSEAARKGVQRLLLTHPELPLSNFSLEFQQQMIRLGAVIERCFLPHLPVWGGFPFERTAAEIKQLGAEHCVLSTDLGQRDSPPPVQGLDRFRRELARHGLSGAELEQLTCLNPAALLGF